LRPLCWALEFSKAEGAEIAKDTEKNNTPSEGKPVAQLSLDIKLIYKWSVMDELERKILEIFDTPGSRTRTLKEFGGAPGVRDSVATLLERGWLRAADAPDTYARTEDGRLQLVAPRDVTIYSRPGCHLCEEAKVQIAPVLRELGARLTEINIDEDPELRARYDYDVPVILIGARKAAKHRVDPKQFRRQLRDAISA
jgi:glutaredoxin